MILNFNIIIPLPISSAREISDLRNRLHGVQLSGTKLTVNW